MLLVFFADARAQAEALDAEFAQTGKVRGPLHGVPVSFKDTCKSLVRAGAGAGTVLTASLRACS